MEAEGSSLVTWSDRIQAETERLRKLDSLAMSVHCQPYLVAYKIILLFYAREPKPRALFFWVVSLFRHNSPALGTRRIIGDVKGATI